MELNLCKNDILITCLKQDVGDEIFNFSINALVLCNFFCNFPYHRPHNKIIYL